jgi:hypothetical protein
MPAKVKAAESSSLERPMDRTWREKLERKIEALGLTLLLLCAS